MQALDKDLELRKDECTPENGYLGKYRDEITGQVLKDSLEKIAREKELQFFDPKNV